MEQILPAKVPSPGPSGYVICLHRKNNPRISVKVCEQSCLFKKECQEYRVFFAHHPGPDQTCCAQG
jgi:hypothetical protein